MFRRGQYLQVDGRPFFMLGGQVNNSSAYTPGRMASLWGVLRTMHANTAEVPVYWEQMEPQEGVYDFAMLDALLAGARQHGLKLVLLWFATWKNGSMKYAPAWVKQQPERFQRVRTPEDTSITALSPHCAANQEADQRAFCAMLQHLRQGDAEQRTVIMIQIENEPGSLGSDRDYAPSANALFAGAVPQALLDVLPKATRPLLRRAWEQNGCRTAGSWPEVFGDGAAEVFSAWAVARYIGQIAKAGKRVYDLPLYVNVWVREVALRVAGYDYPSGGAVDSMLDVWKAAAPAVDLLAPDIYIPDTAGFRELCAYYDREDNPLLIPECGLHPATARHLFYAIAEHGAIGVAPFGIDNLLDEQGQMREQSVAFVQTYASLEAILPLLPQYQQTGRIHAIVQEEGAGSQFLALDGYDALVQFGVTWFGRPIQTGAPGAERGRGLIIQTGPKEFFVTGIGFTVYLRPQGRLDRTMHRNNWASRLDGWLLVEAGRFVGDHWVAEERRSGDESDYGLVLAKPGQAVRALWE